MGTGQLCYRCAARCLFVAITGPNYLRPDFARTDQSGSNQRCTYYLRANNVGADVSDPNRFTDYRTDHTRADQRAFGSADPVCAHY
jgi:hypothetical protein